MVKDMSKREETVKVKKKPKIKHLRMEDIINNNSIEPRIRVQYELY